MKYLNRHKHLRTALIFGVMALFFAFLTPVTVKAAQAERGYSAIGGEYITLAFAVYLAMGAVCEWQKHTESVWYERGWTDGVRDLCRQIRKGQFDIDAACEPQETQERA